MPKAWNLLREQPWYRQQAFSKGLAQAGFEVSTRTPTGGRPGDVLLIWNRYGAGHLLATRFEAEGGTVLVAENGYLGRGGTSPKFDVHPAGPRPEHYYALAVGGHNGQGSWPNGGPERWDELGVELRPWRTTGGHVLVCPNRSFGVPGRIMPTDWAEATAKRLRGETRREIRVRAHPGNDTPRRPLAADLEGAWAAVIWSSGAGIQSLIAGIPTFVASSWWICKDAAARGRIDDPEMPDRLPALHRMAWAQWRVEEIELGEPFARLLSAAGEGAIAVGS